MMPPVLRILETLLVFGWWLVWRTPERLCTALKWLGPTYLKSAQFFSGRVGGEYGRHMAQLLDHVPPPPFENMCPVIERNLGCSIEERYSLFNEVAVGCGSIAPAYYGIWREGGEEIEVATKVIPHGVAARVKEDVALMLLCMRIACWLRIPAALSMRTAKIPEQFAEWIEQETDPRHEGANLDWVAPFHKGTGCHVPKKVFASAEILVMTWMPGVPLTASPEELHAAGLDPRASLRRLSEMMFIRWFILGVGFPFQGNPSRGNLLAMPNGEIGIIDWGLVGFVPAKFLKVVNNAIFAVYQGTGEEVVRAMLALCSYEFKKERRKERFVRDVQAYVEKAKSEPFGYWLMGMGWILMRHRVPAPPEFAIAARFAMDLDEAVRTFSPGYTVHDMLGPILRLAILRRDLEEGRLLPNADSAKELLGFVAQQLRNPAGLLSHAGLLKEMAGFAARQLQNPTGVLVQALVLLPELVRQER
jgi:ubiquinone biosynthesis protein